MAAYDEPSYFGNAADDTDGQYSEALSIEFGDHVANLYAEAVPVGEDGPDDGYSHALPIFDDDTGIGSAGVSDRKVKPSSLYSKVFGNVKREATSCGSANGIDNKTTSYSFVRTVLDIKGQILAKAIVDPRKVSVLSCHFGVHRI